jgi:hypothetical protein
MTARAPLGAIAECSITACFVGAAIAGVQSANVVPLVAAHERACYRNDISPIARLPNTKRQLALR